MLSLKEHLIYNLDEGQVVNFGKGRVFPNYGWCVVVTGGAGSGKSFKIEHNIPINAKGVDVDKLKEQYIKLTSIHTGKYDKKGKEIKKALYDLSKPEDVSYLHNLIKEKGWKKKIMSNLLNSDIHDENRLPNIILDVTGKNNESLEPQTIALCKSLGYKIAFVWVVTNRNVALFRNLARDRSVSNSLIHKIHNMCNDFLPKYIKGEEGDTTKLIDVAYILFGSKENLKNQFWDKDGCFELKKTSKGFEFPNGLEEKVMEILGPNEIDPDNPKIYQDEKDIRKQITSYKVLNKKGKWETKYKTDATDFMRH